MNGFAGGAVAGGLLGVLLGNKSMRKMAGGVAGYGGAAVIGALALRAYQNWQQGKDAASVAREPMTALPPPEQIDRRFLPSAQQTADGTPFELVLVKAMIGAAEGPMGISMPASRAAFSRRWSSRSRCRRQARSCSMRWAKLVDLGELVGAAQSNAQKSEIYLAARLAIEPDQPAERAYLEALAHRLALPAELTGQLDAQVISATR